MTSTILILFFVLLPCISLITTIISLCLFWGAKSENKSKPGSYTDVQIMRYKLIAIVSAVITGAFALIILGVVGLLYMAVAFM